MPADLATVETPAPGVLLVRYEWPHHLAPDAQGEFLDRVLAASAAGPVGIVFAVGDRIREIPPDVRVFWRRVVTDPALRISAIAVVTECWAVAIEAEAFGVTNKLDGAPVRVATFEREHDAIAWAERMRARSRFTPVRPPAPPRRGAAG